MTVHWKSHLWRNAITNYLRVGVRMVTGLVMFRLLFENLSTEEVGYWALLWSVFGYTILMDFGLGLAAQRESAYRSTTGEWEHLSRLLSTTVWTFMGFGVLILIFFAIIQPYFLEWIHISPANRASFGIAYWYFFGALAVSFPLGIFPEMLAGMQRLDLANWTQIISSIVSTILVYVAVRLHWTLETIVLISVLSVSVIPNVANYFMVRRLMPSLSLSPKLFHFGAVKSVLSFSLAAYVIIFSNLIVTRTSQLIISVCLGVISVTIFQAGYKVSEFFGLLTHQLQRALSPAAAHLRAKKDEAALQHLVVLSTRLTTLFSVPGYFLAAVYLDPVIQTLTGLKRVIDAKTGEMLYRAAEQVFTEAEYAAIYWVGQILLLNVVAYLITTSCSRRILLMTGLENKLLKASVVNAVLNLALTLVLVFKYGVVGVTIGTLVPGVLIGCLWVLHMTLRAVNLSLGEWCRLVYAPILAPVALSLAVLTVLVGFWPVPASGSFILPLMWRGLLVMLPVGIYAAFYRGKFF